MLPDVLFRERSFTRGFQKDSRVRRFAEPNVAVRIERFRKKYVSDPLHGVSYVSTNRSVQGSREIVEKDRTAHMQVAVNNLMNSESYNVAQSPAWCFC